MPFQVYKCHIGLHVFLYSVFCITRETWWRQPLSTLIHHTVRPITLSFKRSLGLNFSLIYFLSACIINMLQCLLHSFFLLIAPPQSISLLFTPVRLNNPTHQCICIEAYLCDCRSQCLHLLAWTEDIIITYSARYIFAFLLYNLQQALYKT